MSEPNHDATQDLDVLVEVARRMGETFELVPLLQTIEHAGRSAMGCERATIFLYDHETEELYSKVATGTGEIRFSARLGIAGEAAQTRSVVVVRDAYADPRFNPAIDKRTGYHTHDMLTLPLITPDGEVIGVLQVLNKLDGSFSPRDEVLAAALGSLTAIAVKRQMLLDEAAVKQRLEHDLNIARDIQQRLLPAENPKIKGFDVAGWNQPADQTGGDCYDFRALGEDQLAFMIADATGHGIGPALIVSECRALIRAVTDTSNDLSVVADKVNVLLCADLPSDRFVTVCFGLVDAEAGRLSYVSAGHGPLLLLRAATGQVEQFDATGLPMGIMPDAPIELAEPIELAPGDVFILLTDGFVEWPRPSGELYGDERLVEVIRRHRGQPCADLIQTIYRDVLRFAENTPQLDDLTAILIKRVE